MKIVKKVFKVLWIGVLVMIMLAVILFVAAPILEDYIIKERKPDYVDVHSKEFKKMQYEYGKKLRKRYLKEGKIK